MSAPCRDPLQRQFVQNAQYLIDHPPPPMMLWVLSELLRATVDMVVILEARRAEEMRAEQLPLEFNDGFTAS